MRSTDELEDFFDEWDPLCKDMMAKMEADANGSGWGEETEETSQEVDRENSSPCEPFEDREMLDEGPKKADVAKEKDL